MCQALLWDLEISISVTKTHAHKKSLCLQGTYIPVEEDGKQNKTKCVGR